MSQKPEEKRNGRTPRRKFFGQLLSALAGGVFVGGLVQRFLISSNGNPQREESITITVNPLAVPRSKEGSKANV